MKKISSYLLAPFTEAGSKGLKDGAVEIIGRHFRTSALLIVVGLLIVAAQWLWFREAGYNFTRGAPAGQTYRAVVPMKYSDRAAAESLREQARSSVVEVVVRDATAQERLVSVLDDLDAVCGRNGIIPRHEFPKQLVDILSAMDADDRYKLLADAKGIGAAYLSKVESVDSVPDAHAKSSALWEEISARGLDSASANLVYQILDDIDSLGFRRDDRLKNDAGMAAADYIPDIERNMLPGDVIVARGETVTEQAAQILRFQGYSENVLPFPQFASVVLIVLFMPLWLELIGLSSVENKPSKRCIVFLTLTAWILETVASLAGIVGAGVLPTVLAVCLCVHGDFAFTLSLTVTLSAAFLVMNIPVYQLFLLLSTAMITSAFGFCVLRRIASRESLGYRIFFLAAAMTVIRAVCVFAQGVPVPDEAYSLFPHPGVFWSDSFWFIMFDLAACSVIIFLIPLIEGHIDVLSMMKINELTSPSYPLFRRLQRDAPGTYQHCLTIAVLAGAVARELGLDENLMKVGVYYHDIGKLRNPQRFVENQGGGVNTHDKMVPSLSAKAIIAHVHDGLKLADEAGLPRRIRDFIAEHHGTTCVRYFYNKALSQGPAEWSDFCYPGPKPRSRETALLMILDSMEAAVRSVDLGAALLSGGAMPETVGNRKRSQSIDALRKVVSQVITSKINEGQFDNVGFTQADYARIKDAVINVLLSMYHTRTVKKIEKKPNNQAVGKIPQGSAENPAQVAKSEA